MLILSTQNYKNYSIHLKLEHVRVDMFWHCCQKYSNLILWENFLTQTVHNWSWKQQLTKTSSFITFSRKSLRYAALGTGCTLTAAPRSTQPSTLWGTVNEYQPYGWVVTPMAMGECSAYSSLQTDSKVKFAAWPTRWRPPGADRLWPRGTTVNSRIWLVL